MSKNKLAIHGGTPVFNRSAPDWPITTPSIKAAITQALDDGSWGKYEGQWTETLSRKLGDYFHRNHVMLCSSGTIGVELALRGVGVKPDSEVILAGYDFPGNFRAVEAIGAFPVLVDVTEGGWIINPGDVANAISDSTSAIIVSHLHGQIANIEKVRAAATGIPIVEDACQNPGARLDGQPIGCLGDVSVLSFGGSKLLSAGRGGAILTSDSDVYQRAKIFANRGNDSFPLSQLQAAALVPQLDVLDDLTQQRFSSVTSVLNSTAGSEWLLNMTQDPDLGDCMPAFYKLPWLLDPKFTRSDFVTAIQAEGLSIDAAFRGFTRRTARRCRKVGPLVNAQIAAQQTIILHHPILLEDQETVAMINEAIEKVTQGL